MNDMILDRRQINYIIRFVLCFFFISICAFFISIRAFGLDSDYLAYVRFYESLNSTFDIAQTRFEPGFYSISFFFKTVLGLDIFWVMFFVSFVSLLIKFYLFSKNKNYILIGFLYLISFAPLHEMTQVRAALGIAFAFLALYKKHEGENLQAFFLLIIAISLHYSTIYIGLALVIPKGFVTNKLNMKSVLFYSLCATFVVYLAFNLIISFFPIIDLYVKRASTETFNFMSVRVVFLIPVLVLGFLSFKNLDEFQKRCFLLSFMGMIITPVTSIIPTVASRLYELSMVGYFFWLPGVYKFKRSAIAIFGVVCCFLFLRNFFLAPIFN